MHAHAGNRIPDRGVAMLSFDVPLTNLHRRSSLDTSPTGIGKMINDIFIDDSDQLTHPRYVSLLGQKIAWLFRAHMSRVIHALF
jgi:hypothetical protein